MKWPFFLSCETDFLCSHEQYLPLIVFTCIVRIEVLVGDCSANNQNVVKDNKELLEFL